MKEIIFTSSWDDGHKLDLKLAEFLDKYNIKGTFYVPKRYTKEPLSFNDIIKLSKKHEIGAHTLSHPELDKISLADARREIEGSKQYLEKLLNKEVKMFCYPRGKINDKVEEIVKESGFLGARSTQKFCIQKPVDYFKFGVSIHIYPFPLRKKDASHYLLNRNLFDPLRLNYKKIKKLNLSISAYFSWQKLARNLFNYTMKNGELFHLYGHSHEIERYGMWEELELFLRYINKKKNIKYYTNSEVLDFFKK